MARPARRRVHDRITFGAASLQDHIIDHAVAPFDRAVRASEQLWGIDRLPEMVSPETAAKWGSALGRLNAALGENDATAVQHMVNVCLRGLAAMDAEARSRGHTPPDPIVIETQQDDHHFGILLDGALWQRAQEQRPGLRLYTLREVSVALRYLDSEGVRSVAAAFPGAEIVAARRQRSGPVPDDPIDLMPTADPEEVEF